MLKKCEEENNFKRESLCAADVEFEFIRLAAAGNLNAFKELFNLNVGRIHDICLRISRDANQADEMTQEVFIEAWEKMQTFNFDCKFSSWLRSITIKRFLYYSY